MKTSTPTANKKASNQKDFEKKVLLNIAHEFKNPLTVILGHLELLPKLKGEKKAKSISEMKRCTYELDHFLKSLLFLENPQIPFSFCDPLEIIHKAKGKILSLYPEAKIKVKKKNSDILICVNPNLLEIALYNLLDNAVKYSTHNKEVVVDIKKISKWIQISIQDRGIGMKKEHLKKIFERFFTCDQTLSFEKGGFGLGLNLVKSIMDKHQGKIHVKSSFHQGSTFILSLPIK
jgi:signal transduction histidine kinase